MAAITITATAPQAARVVHCVGVRLGLGRDATLTEVHDYLVEYLKTTVRVIEQSEAVSTSLDLT